MLGSLEDTLMMSQIGGDEKPCLDFAHLHARAGDGSLDEFLCGMVDGFGDVC